MSMKKIYITESMQEMKITKRQMHQIVKEAIRGTIHGDPNKEAFLDITMNAISKADYKKAAQAIMDSYFIDDVWDEEIEALVSMLASSRTGSTAPATTMEIEAIADDWMDGKRAGKWAPENIQEGNKMKVTKRQLRRIIKEEKAKLLNEQQISFEQIMDNLYAIADVAERHFDEQLANDLRAQLDMLTEPA